MGQNCCTRLNYCPDKNGKLIAMPTINADFIPDEDFKKDKKDFLLTTRKLTISYDEPITTSNTINKTKTIDSSPVPRLALTNTLKDIIHQESEEFSSKNNKSLDRKMLSSGEKSNARISKMISAERKSEAKMSMNNSKDGPSPNMTSKSNASSRGSNFKRANVIRRTTEKHLSGFIMNESNRNENFDPVIDEDITDEQEEFIRSILERNKLLRNFDAETINELCLSFFITKIPQNSQLFKIGEPANLFYIICDGYVELESENGETQMLNYGKIFGKESLEENSLRKENAKIVTDATLLCLSGELYRNAIEFQNLKNMNDRITILKTIPYMKNLDQIKVIGMSQMIQMKVYERDSILIQEDSNFDKIYFIKEGRIRVIKSSQIVDKLYDSDYFGDVSLLVKKPSYYTYQVESPTASIYQLTYKSIYEVLGDSFAKTIIYRLFLSAISKSEKINEYLFEDVKELFNIFSLKYYAAGEVVYPTNHLKNKKICIVVCGQLRKQSKGEILVLTEEVFGEKIIDSKENLDENIVSNDITLTLEANWVDILKSFKSGDSLGIGNLYETVKKIKRIPLFSALSEIKLYQLAKRMTKEVFLSRDEIIREGSVGNKFYIIKSGRVKVYQKGKFIREMETGSCFGEIALFVGSARTCTIITSDQTECFVLKKDSFNEVVDMELLKHIQKILSLQDINVNIENLYYVKTLGQGRYGKVFLVHNQKNFYAIKMGSVKEICSKGNLIKYFINEKNVMLTTDHPFIIKLVKTMKNKDFIFFLLEYIDGITLKSYLEKRNKNSFRDVFETSFYGAILLSAINYLHKKRILHRDIKPDNLMIDRNGYLKLIDFGIAKLLKDTDYTHTCCGTPHYLAPEVIMGKGYSFSADYWSIGVVMYEIFYGQVPFGYGKKQVMDIYQEILNKNLTFVIEQRYTDINNFFKIILSRNLIHRVCNYNLLRSHPFLYQVDFDLLTEFGIKAPFFPESFLDKNVSAITNTFSPLTNYLENSQYNTKASHDSKVNETYEREISWLDDF